MAYLFGTRLLSPRDGSSASPEGAVQPRATAQGVTEAEVLLGMSAPFSGPARELGRGMELGINTYLHSVNDEGGVAGRKLRLVALDDGYEPERALANMQELDQQRKVFAVIGNVGTPTAEKTLPYALEKQLIFFGAFTGAKLLRKEPPDRFVFNYRAGYEEGWAFQGGSFVCAPTGEVMTAAYFRAHMPSDWRKTYEALLQAAQRFAEQHSRNIRAVTWPGVSA